MRALIVPISAIILGISIVQLANGFLGTLVSMNSAGLGFSPIVMGVVLAAYYGGYTIGAASMSSLLLRVGHIRLFAALAGLAAASVALQPVLTSPVAWIAIRLLTGLGCAGLFVTAESWLNANAQPQDRGAIFAVYMVATNACFGAGQFLINLPAPRGFELFSLAAALFCLALIPVSLTRSVAPATLDSPRMHLRDLRRLAPVSFAGCIATGLIGSSFYSLIPAYAQIHGIPASSISAFIATAIFGGLAFQIPIGRLSDRLDRRLVAIAIASGFVVTALLLAMLPTGAVPVLALTFLLGGFMSTIYPVCVAHANDRVEPDEVIAVSGQLILVQGLASFVGPILGTAIMGRNGISGVYIYMAVVASLFVAGTVWRVRQALPPQHKERSFVILADHMSQPLAHVAEDEEIVSGEAGHATAKDAVAQ
jgi:MFS family permease